MPLSGRIFVVAGATSGIGKSCAEEVMRRGGHVFGIGRRADHPLSGYEAYTPVQMDLTQSDAIQELKRLLMQNSEISDVICCVGGGVGAIGDYEQLKMTDIEDAVTLNVVAPMRLLRVVLPHLRKRESGDVFIVGSEASLRGAKRGSVYAATKFAIRGLTQSLRAEYARYCVRVIGVYPGMTRTPFFEELDFEPGSEEAHALMPEDIAVVIADAAVAPERVVMDEIVLSPRLHVIQSKRKQGRT